MDYIETARRVTLAKKRAILFAGDGMASPFKRLNQLTIREKCGRILLH